MIMLPQGFRLAAAAADFRGKHQERRDLALAVSDVPAAAAANRNPWGSMIMTTPLFLVGRLSKIENTQKSNREHFVPYLPAPRKRRGGHLRQPCAGIDGMLNLSN